MLDCFACGSEYSDDKPILEVKQIIEYIEYDFDKKEVRVAGDFFIENRTDIAANLKIIHPGNFEFNDASLQWFSDNLPAKILRTFFKPYYKLNIDPDTKSVELLDTKGSASCCS